MQNVQVKWFVFLVGLILARDTAPAQGFSDMFAGSQLLTGVTAATITGSNTNATVEPGEPKHAGKVGGHSVWISWLAPGDGLVTLSTTGSSFDTLLAVYVLQPGNDPPLERLDGIASDDDYDGLVTSFVQFGANSNQTYQIAVDGFSGATGNISLQLSFLSSSNLQPTVVRSPGDQSLRLGDPLILTMSLVPSPNLQFKWYLNGSPVSSSDDDSSNPTLVIPSLQRTNLGLYSLKFYLNDDSFFSSAIEIQVNSEGQPNVLARNKLADAALSGLSISTTQSGVTGGVILGYNGTQIFNTTNAVVDTNAPLVCGVPPGAAYWFSYQAPTNGVMTIDTTNSGFATVLAVFTYTGTLLSYTNLIPVNCNIDTTGTNTGTSVTFTTTNGGNYFIVVGGVNGARGIAHLNYSLSAGLPPVPPVLTSQPQSLLVVTQTAVALSVVASGTAPFSYQWWKNNSRVRQQTNASYLLRSPQSQDSGTYFVVVTNLTGAITSAPANVTVISSALVSLIPASNWMISAFPGIRGYQYAVDCTASPFGGGWWNWTNAFPDYGGVIWLTNSTTANGGLFLRVHTP
jgi:hypothetical protein